MNYPKPKLFKPSKKEVQEALSSMKVKSLFGKYYIDTPIDKNISLEIFLQKKPCIGIFVIENNTHTIEGIDQYEIFDKLCEWLGNNYKAGRCPIHEIESYYIMENQS